MAQIRRSALVPYSAEQMYQLVNDVNAYPQFLPGCVNANILAKSADQMTASVEVAKAGISKRFVTRNTLLNNQSVTMQLVEGPFRRLVGYWTFTSLQQNACKIEFNLDFEFSNLLIELAFGKIFKDLANNMVQAFTRRAKEVYCG